MNFLLFGSGYVCTGAVGQSNGLHTPGCPVFDSLVAEKTGQRSASDPDRSFPCVRRWHGVTRRLVGTLSSGDESCCVSVS